MASAFQTGQRGNPHPQLLVAVFRYDGRLVFTFGHARKKHAEESKKVKKETFWNLQRRKTFFHSPVKCVHMITNFVSPPFQFATLRPVSAPLGFCPTH